jgi:hypothetical protein
MTVTASIRTSGFIQPIDSFCAERHIGLVPENPTSNVAAANQAKLNAALAAQWAGGNFRIVGGTSGPILRPISFPAREYYFEGPIKTSKKMGGGMFGSMRCRGYSLASGASYVDSIGGALTKCTRIDGENGGSILRLRGTGFTVEGIEFKGRRYDYDPTGGGPDGVGSLPAGTTATPSGIEVEARGTIYGPASGRHVIRNCTITDCTYGIRCLCGFYTDLDNGDEPSWREGNIEHGHPTTNPGFFENEDHADNGIVENVLFYRVPTIFRCENQQAAIWRLKDLDLNAETITLLDIIRGGNVWVDGISGNCVNLTLLQVKDYSQHTSLITMRNVKWDHIPTPSAYFTLFKYIGPDTYNISGLKWHVRIEGQGNNLEEGSWDPTKLIEVSSSARANNFCFDDILIDMAGGIPESGFTKMGRWLVPTALA